MTTEIKLDYDKITVKDVQLIFHHRAWLLKYFKIMQVQAFETKRGYHVLVEIADELDPRDVLLLQILMGSDIQRDIYNFIRNTNGEFLKDWSRLYTKKYAILSLHDIEEISGEVNCPELLERITSEIEDAKDWRGMI